MANDSKYCTECGTKNPGDANYCKRCGLKISNDRTESDTNKIESEATPKYTLTGATILFVRAIRKSPSTIKGLPRITRFDKYSNEIVVCVEGSGYFASIKDLTKDNIKKIDDALGIWSIDNVVWTARWYFLIKMLKKGWSCCIDHKTNQYICWPANGSTIIKTINVKF